MMLLIIIYVVFFILLMIFIIFVLLGLGFFLFMIVSGVLKNDVNICVCVILLWLGDIIIMFFNFFFLKYEVSVGVVGKLLIGILKKF